MSGSASYVEVEKKKRSTILWLKKEMTWKKELIPIKIIQFLYSGGTNSLLPYLTLHMKELGLSMKQIGVIYAFLPIATILGPPLSGMVADRSGKYKLVVLMNMLLTIVLHVALLYLPGEGLNHLRVFCNDHEQTLQWDKCHTCHHHYQNINFSLTLKNCKFMCDNPPSNLEVCLYSETDSSDFCRVFNITDQIILNGTVSAKRENGTCSHTWPELRHEDQVFHRVNCPSTCPVQCESEGAPHCSQAEGESSSNSTVFWTYFLVRMIATFFLSSLFTMMDAMTMAIVKQHGGEYGKQRFLFILGMATVPLIAGFLNDWDAGSNGTSQYLPAMYLGAALCLAASVFIARLNFKVDMGKENVFQDLKQLVVKPEINIYFLVILILGSNWGFIESYLFLYMGQLGSPNYLMGLTMTVGSVIGMPVMLIADQIVNKVGRHIIFIISFFSYALRHFGYSFISNPWMVFPFELLEIFTYQLMWVAAVTFCPILAPPGLLATMTGVAGAVHFSVGRGVGSFIGGQLISHMDIPGAFRCYGVIAFGSGVLYILIHFCYFKKKLSVREDQLKNVTLKKNPETEITAQTPMMCIDGDRSKDEVF